MTSAEIRQQFIDFFVAKHGHTFVPSSPVVPHDDPTLLFTNAGMNQFKPIFLGTERRAYTRAANTQKCIRAGGKHNDLDDVGRSRRHHTFFEMLGNWSFGDYFKQGAIEMAWELLTKVWKLDPTRLHVSCFEGDEKNGVPRDTEAAAIWKQVANLPDDHIHYFGKDNFWEMGDTGPCGPCTEIYIDRTPDKSGGPQVNGDDPRVMEIWNNVFIQYNRNADRSLTVLPSQHVDTGMGFERITQVLQDKQDNYGIDLFDPFWDALKKLSGITYTGLYPPSNAADPVAESANPQLRHDIAFRVIADHIRCLTFALTDGAVPSNEGRGYVLRRILRRAVRFGRQQLELREPFLHTLVPVVVEAMGGAFPELKKEPQRVVELVKEEEVSFGRTLDRGIQLFEEAARAATKQYEAAPVMSPDEPSRRFEPLTEKEIAHRAQYPAAKHLRPLISAEDAFKLHDTYGFPIDLTRIMAEERGLRVDIEGYERLMEDARNRARAGGKEGDSRLFELPPDVIAKLHAQKVAQTDDSAKFNRAQLSATVKAIWDGKNLVDVEDAEDDCAIILDRTSFYSEMGGQIGDYGDLLKTTSAFEVRSTRTVGGYVLHIGKSIKGLVRIGDKVNVRVVLPTRERIEKNHTATHLANWALREVLGEGVQQKGSLVDPDKLRFDFSHGKALSEPEVGRVEELVAQAVEKKLPVYAEEAPQEQALKINGLRAVFGEKYPPLVRVVSVGAPVGELLASPADARWREYSVEFCGGTHLKNTADVGGFVVTGEESVSKGVRRLLALTGDAAAEAQAVGRQVDALAEAGRAAADAEVPGVVAPLNKILAAPNLPLRAKRRGQAALAELQARHKAWEKTQRAATSSGVDPAAAAAALVDQATSLGGGKLVVGELAGLSSDQLLAAMDSLKKKLGSYAVLLAAADDGKVSFVAAVSDDLVKQGLKAGDWIKETAKPTGGGGGGRPQMAQGSGKDPAKLSEALEAAREYARQVIK